MSIKQRYPTANSQETVKQTREAVITGTEVRDTLSATKGLLLESQTHATSIFRPTESGGTFDVKNLSSC